MSRNWLFHALLCILKPAYLFDTNSFCLTGRISQKVGIRILVQPKKIVLSVCFCPFYQPAAVKVSRSRPPSQLITVLSCHIIRQRWAREASAAVLNFETDRPSVGCQIVSSKWPAYSPSLSTCCPRLPWQRHISGNQRQTDKWKETPTDREQCEIKKNDFLILLQYINRDTSKKGTNAINNWKI